MSLSPGIYWHPLDLPYYFTVRDLSEFGEALILVPVTAATPAGEGSEYILSAVWAPTHAEMVAGDWDYLSEGVRFSEIGFHKSSFNPISESALGEICIGMVLEVQTSCDDLALGRAELRCR
jgi:hypothetical protein